MHPTCFPPQTQRAQMFSFLSCEGALQSLLKAQHGRAVNSTAVKGRRKEREREKRKGKERQRQSKDTDKEDGECEREKRKRKRKERERESVGRASELWSEFVARGMLSVGPGSRYGATTQGDVTRREDERLYVSAKKSVHAWAAASLETVTFSEASPRARA